MAVSHRSALQLTTTMGCEDAGAAKVTLAIVEPAETVSEVQGNVAVVDASTALFYRR